MEELVLERVIILRREASFGVMKTLTIQIFSTIISPIAIRYNGTSARQGHGYQVHVGPVRSDARGHVRIRSADPTVYPEVVLNYLHRAR